MRLTALTVFCLFIATLSTIPIVARVANARTHPDRPTSTEGPQAVVSATGEFNCGTWRDTGNSARWYESRRVARLKEIQASRVSAFATLDSIPMNESEVNSDTTTASKLPPLLT